MYLSVGSSLNLGVSKSSSLTKEYLPCISVRNAASSPSSSSSSQEQFNGEDSMILRPSPKLKRKSQWSKGDGPGEYGGPPSDVRLRRTWGGNPMEDPLTSTDDYIWKKVWQPHVEAAPSSVVPASPPPKEPESGFLSLNRAIVLDSMEVDLSQELMKPSKATLDRQVEAARQAAAAAAKRAEVNKSKWRPAPTKREEQLWSNARKAASGGTEMLMREVARERSDPVKVAAAERERYIKLKRDLQVLTLAIGGAGVVMAYVSYSPEIAASYGAGLLGAVAYIRMLANSTDSIGASDASSAVRGALGQPRLLVPMVLVMFFNRWNGLVVPEYGLMQLQLIPMLVGFFTYKAATLVEAFRELLPSPQQEIDS